ncbi:hypothetical protein MIDIC_20035 [Alphaproteobacteria bacterium]
MDINKIRDTLNDGDSYRDNQIRGMKIIHRFDKPIYKMALQDRKLFL